MISPGWITKVLRASGYLPQGAVLSCEIKASDTFNSNSNFVSVRYSEDVPSGLCTDLFIKLPLQGQDWALTAGKTEAEFYRYILGHEYPRITAPCFAAGLDESGIPYVILKNVSDTHRPPITRDQQIKIVDGVPRDDHLTAMINTLAQFHAYWWEHPLLGSGVVPFGRWYGDDKQFGNYVKRRKASFEQVKAEYGGLIGTALLQKYEDVIQRMPILWQRYLQPRFQAKHNITANHGDSYFANFLCPKQPGSGETYLIDWQGVSVHIGCGDLINMYALFWTREQRRNTCREDKIMRQYYEGLLAGGVTRYSWDDFILDYRLSLIEWFLVPVQDAADRSSKEYWWPKMQCISDTFMDWDAYRLLCD